MTTPDKTLQASLASLDEERELLRRRCEIKKDLSLATIQTEEQDKRFQKACDALADVYKFTRRQGAPTATEIEYVRTRIDLVTKKVSETETETEAILQQSRRDSEGVSHFYDTLTTLFLERS